MCQAWFNFDAAAFLGDLRDLALAGAAVVTAAAAVRGLRTWRQELRGKADFDVARGLIRATYKVRDEIQSCRSPLISGSEYPPGYQTPAPGAHVDARAEAEAAAHMYQNRWQRVQAALQEFDSQTLEAEALWGPDIRTSTQELRRCAHTLFVSIEAIVEDRAAGGEIFQRDREFARQMRANAHAPPMATDNALSNEIDAAVRELEAKLRGHLTRPR